MAIDAFGRNIHYLRVSITDRCNFRCTYCMPAEGVKWLPPEEILTYEELQKVITTAVSLGINKVRITGGEPLVRNGVVDFVASVANIPGIKDLAMTTNGSLLEEYAGALKRAGLKRINISLDTLQREKFKKLCHKDELSKVLGGVAAAEKVGLLPIKINMVVIRGVNDNEIAELARLSISKPYQIRFIEYMPFNSLKKQAITAEDMKIILNNNGLCSLVPEPLGDGPAQIYRLPGALGTIGFISPISKHFCNSCNRIRLTADGKLKPCLLSNQEYDIKALLRRGAPNDHLAFLLKNAILEKPAKHFVATTITARSMSQIGG